MSHDGSAISKEDPMALQATQRHLRNGNPAHRQANPVYTNFLASISRAFAGGESVA